jgi:DNA processing protein
MDLTEKAAETLIALHECEGIGWLTMNKLVKLEGFENAAEWRAGDWRDRGLTPRQAAAAAACLKPEAVEASRKARERAGISAVTIFDPRYPPLLRESVLPPWVLYYMGDLRLAAKTCVSVVGTRTATAYGRRVAEDWAAAWSSAGLAVVSGLARGIDAAAHVGALQGPGGTIAVLAGPLDTPYPPENRGLFRRIVERGLALSEMPLGVQLRRGLFSLRNRIIAGMSAATVIVEAGEGSGALITAAKAAEASREVYVVPGPVTSPRSIGALRLLGDGGRALVAPDDLFRDVHYARHRAGADSAPQPRQPLLPEERRVYDLLLDSPRSIDELLAASGMTFGLLHSVLLSLQIKRLITQQPGSVYTVL